MAVSETHMGTVGDLRIVRRATTENENLWPPWFVLLDSSGKQINGMFDSFAVACEYADYILHERTLRKSRSSPQGSSTPGTDPGMGM